MENLVPTALPFFFAVTQEHDIVANLHDRVHIMAVHNRTNIILLRNILYQLVYDQTSLFIDAVSGLYDSIVHPDLFVRRMFITASRVISESDVRTEEVYEQMDLFTDYKALEKKKEAEKAERDREKKVQQALMDIKKKYGKNAIVRGLNMQEGATGMERNAQIGGHKA